MTPVNSVLSPASVAVAERAPATPPRRILRASEVERECAPDSPLARSVAWVREFLARAHPDLGRSGPVCPFTPMALNLDTIWLVEIADDVLDLAAAERLLDEARQTYLALEPSSGPAAINKAILLVFPNLGDDAPRVIDGVQYAVKPSFVEAGLMLGEFHAANQSPGLRNPNFFPLRSPVPMLAIRHIVESDLPFLRRPSDSPERRAAYARAYLRRLGPQVTRNSFEQAVAILVEAELQIRAAAPAPEPTAATGCPVHRAPAATPAAERVAIVGGGLAGSLLALALAQRGFGVDVYERRADPRVDASDAGRSINLGLSKRGIQALAEVGLLDEVLPLTVVMSGRVIHAPDGGTRYQPYGKDAREVLHSIDRNELNRLLLERARAHPNVSLHFEHRLAHIDKDARELALEADGRTVRVRPAWVIGTDGAFSSVRREMQRGERANYQQEYLEWGYKELTLAALPGGGSAIELRALHVWPRGHCLFVSHPNRDGSHTLTLFLPFEGPDSFATARDAAGVRALFDKYFPDLVPLLPNLVEDWMAHPVGTLVTTRTAPWSREDWIVLVGDACHAVYPFYGQGMNSAFEDCSSLLHELDGHPRDRAAAFDAYEVARRRHTDTLAELSKENFVELRQKVRSPMFVVRKRLDVALNRLLPKVWLPLYTMIAHTTMPYADARARARLQERILSAFGVGVLAAAGVLLWLVIRR